MYIVHSKEAHGRRGGDQQPGGVRPDGVDRTGFACVEAALKRRQRRLEADVPGVGTPVSDVLEYHPHADGYPQLEVYRYAHKDGSTKEHGPYWHFRYHEGGKQKALFPRRRPRRCATLREAVKRATAAGGAG